MNISFRNRGRREGLADFFFPIILSKKVAKSPVDREEVERRGGGLRSEEKMLWSL